MTMLKTTLQWGSAWLLTALCSDALAQTAATPVSDPHSAVPSTAAERAAALGSATREPASWFKRHRAVDGMFEIGTGIGLLFPSADHSLQLLSRRHQKIESAEELLIRATWLPIRYAGAEIESAVGSTKTADGMQSYPWAIRAHAIGQLPFWRITPFAVFGFGRIGNVSNSLGADGDPLLHFGGGAKVYLTESMLMRIDVRDNLHQKYASAKGTLTHSPEFQVGLSLTLGRQSASVRIRACAPEDMDGDGIVDARDQCPTAAGEGRDGCPILDTDKDGIPDGTDNCVLVAGVAPTGCPPDADADGVFDRDDQCPNDKGPPPQGCPADQDLDHDGIVDANDKCPKEAENKNGFDDADGCPDLIPDDVKAFTGVIQGITFEHNKATIHPASKPALDHAAGLLKEFESLRVEISGHTDNTGSGDKNVKLSKDRADAVKAYLVEQGIADHRIETRGAGPNEPLDTNATEAGRGRNRRIEFKLLTK
jgi:outer membrane protein OmpA-like peptidoglycan-associated protein